VCFSARLLVSKKEIIKGTAGALAGSLHWDSFTLELVSSSRSLKLSSAPNLRWTSVSATIYQQVHSVTIERKKHNILVFWLVFAYVSCSSTIIQRCGSLVGFATEEHPYVPKNFPEYADTFKIWNLYVWAAQIYSEDSSALLQKWGFTTKLR